MAFLVNTQVTVTKVVNLNELAYRDWPSEARSLAKVVLGTTRAQGELLRQIDRKNWLIAQVERLQQDNRHIAEWLGES